MRQMAFRKSWATRSMMAVLGIGLISGCATNPVTGKREFTLVSEGQEIQMGKGAAEEVAQTIGLYDNPATQSYVENLGKKIAAQSERPDLPWTFRVVDDPVVNAFALPGGFIFVTRGLMAHMNSEAQLVSVLGHEIGHVTAKHSVQQISRAQAAQVLLIGGMLASETVAALGEVGMAGLSVLFLKYGRDAERQADDLGFKYSVNTGYDVRAMPGVFATLKRVSESAGAERLPNWLSTHPSPDERIERIQKKITETNPPAGKEDTSSYLAMTDGMTYGPNPRQGFFDNGVFKHPELRFQVTMPKGWKATNLSQAVVAQAPSGDAAFQLTLAKEASPGQALEQFATNQAVSAVEKVDVPVQGLQASSARFQAKTEGGQVGGLVTFVSHQGKTFQLMGLAPATGFAAQEATFKQVQGSFGPLTDQAALTVQPARVKLVTAPSAMTLADLVSKQGAGSGLSVEKVAILNQMDPSTRLQAGQKVKMVQGTVRESSSNAVATR
jgi:predicted Zn-dependent protease